MKRLTEVRFWEKSWQKYFRTRRLWFRKIFAGDPSGASSILPFALPLEKRLPLPRIREF